MSWQLCMAITMLVGSFGELLCKIGATSENRLTFTLTAGVCWFMCSFLWTQIYRDRDLSSTVALYGAIQASLMTIIGIVIFKEPFTAKIALGFVFCMISTFLLA